MCPKERGIAPEIKDLDEKESFGGLSQQNRKEINEAKQDFQEVSTREEITWHQKSRINWLGNGGNNTKFFIPMLTVEKPEIRSIPDY